MKRTVYFFCLFFLLLLPACSDSHFVTDDAYRLQVEQDFNRKKALMPHGDLFAVFRDETLTAYEREALEFLYAYMPLADITDYPGEFHLMNVRSSLRAAEEMPWGKEISESLFRHFVLPVRVNNEHLDSARVVFYGELKERVRSLSLHDAILEVNHWCHEKAVYTPSDARTSSPLATVRTAYGRCGEESTLLVAALRSVGIPARQVYTPRWAHTDDNHAWVEAWADGKWHFLGACEPEPVLNLGWFNAPASRGMLMHTKVFGRYEGKEEVMLSTPNYTEINVTENYAPTATASVLVTDIDGKPVPDAKVEFKLYNYAEFHTVACKRTSGEGTCSFTAGKGDMLVWASREGRFGFAKLSFGKQQALTVVLDKKEGDCFAMDVDLVPPAEAVSLPEVTPEQRAENDRRLAEEDSVRNAYTATFLSEMQMDSVLAGFKGKIKGCPGDELPGVQSYSTLLANGRGNQSTLLRFVQKADSCGKLAKGMALLATLTEKDLRDARCEVLMDHLLFTSDDSEAANILNPRISTEELTPYRSFLKCKFSRKEADAFRASPPALTEWVRKYVTLNDTLNSQRIPVSPEGVWKSRMADAHSRDIFLVALARSLDIPAYIDKVDGTVKYVSHVASREDGMSCKSLPFGFNNVASKESEQGAYVLCSAPQKMISQDEGKYYSTFTVSRIEDGGLKLLNFDEGRGNGRSGVVESGDYLLVTGTRLANGGVLARLSSFRVDAAHQDAGLGNRSQQVPYVRRSAEEQVPVIGSFNSEARFTPVAAEAEKQSLLQACGRGYFVVGILGVNQEPTNHALRDIAAMKEDLEQWGRKMVLLFPDENYYKRFCADEFPGLPSTVIYGIDTEGIAAEITREMKLTQKGALPIFIIADTFNRVVFVSQGYTIGLGEQLIKTVKGLQ